MTETATATNGEIIAPVDLTEAQLPALFDDAEKADALITAIETGAKKMHFDMAQRAGRDDCRAFARQISSAKVLIDNKGKELTEKAREFVDGVNAIRKMSRDRLDALRVTVRQPLTDWEAAEEARRAKIEAAMRRLENLGKVAPGATSETIRGQIAELKGADISAEVFGNQVEEAEMTRDGSLEALSAPLDYALRNEAQARELAELKARQDAEEAERQKIAAAEKAKRDAEEAEQRRAAEKAEAEKREAEEARLAAEQAKADAEARAKEAEERAQRAQEEAEQQKREAEEAAERARLDAEEAVERARQREADEAKRRAEDEKRRGLVIEEAAGSLCAATKLAPATSEKVIAAIVAGKVEHVRIEF